MSAVPIICAWHDAHMLLGGFAFVKVRERVAPGVTDLSHFTAEQSVEIEAHMRSVVNPMMK